MCWAGSFVIHWLISAGGGLLYIPMETWHASTCNVDFVVGVDIARSCGLDLGCLRIAIHFLVHMAQFLVAKVLRWLKLARRKTFVVVLWQTAPLAFLQCIGFVHHVADQKGTSNAYTICFLKLLHIHTKIFLWTEPQKPLCRTLLVLLPQLFAFSLNC